MSSGDSGFGESMILFEFGLFCRSERAGSVAFLSNGL